LCTTLFTITTARKLYTPITKLVKQLAHLPGNAKVNILAHPGIIGFLTLEQNQITHHSTKFTIRINEDNLTSQTMLIRLRQFQLKHKLTSPLWSLDYSILSRLNYHDNLSASILFKMASLDLTFQYSGDTLEWTIPGFSQDLVSLMLETLDLPATVLPSFWSTNHQIYRIGQCISHDGFL